MRLHFCQSVALLKKIWKIQKTESKKDSFRSLSFLEKVFCFLWGVVKLYNVLGGYNVEYIISGKISVHKLAQVSNFFLYRVHNIHHFLHCLHRLFPTKQGFKFFSCNLFFFNQKLCAPVKNITVLVDDLLSSGITPVNDALNFLIYH